MRHLMHVLHVTRHFIWMLAGVVAQQTIMDREDLGVIALAMLQICARIVRVAIALGAVVLSIQLALRERVIGLIRPVVDHQLTSILRW